MQNFCAMHIRAEFRPKSTKIYDNELLTDKYAEYNNRFSIVARNVVTMNCPHYLTMDIVSNTPVRISDQSLIKKQLFSQNFYQKQNYRSFISICTSCSMKVENLL